MVDTNGIPADANNVDELHAFRTIIEPLKFICGQLQIMFYPNANKSR